MCILFSHFYYKIKTITGGGFGGGRGGGGRGFGGRGGGGGFGGRGPQDFGPPEVVIKIICFIPLFFNDMFINPDGQ